MGEKTGIAWTRSTFNAWIGCTEVSPACDNCYARELDKRYKWGGATHWGAGVPRLRTSHANWLAPLRWNKAAPTSEFAGRRGFWPVFCESLSDFADNEVPPEWQRDLEALIDMTRNLSWLLVTKRIGNVLRLYPNWESNGIPAHVRIIASVGNQEEADRDIPKLLALPCKNGISYEPALGGVNLRALNVGNRITLDALTGMHASTSERGTVEHCLATLPPLPGRYARGIEWLIVGGESTQGAGKARPFDRDWAYSTILQCKAAGVPCFVKQLGSNVLARNDEHGCDVYAPRFLHRAGADPAEWPTDLRIQEFPT